MQPQIRTPKHKIPHLAPRGKVIRQDLPQECPMGFVDCDAPPEVCRLCRQYGTRLTVRSV
jgi:hypothetical protein